MSKIDHSNVLKLSNSLFIVCALALAGCEDGNQRRLSLEFEKWRKDHKSVAFIRTDAAGQVVAISRCPLREASDGKSLVASGTFAEATNVNLWLYPGGQQVASYQIAKEFLEAKLHSK